jgi:hypothetical protein
VPVPPPCGCCLSVPSGLYRCLMTLRPTVDPGP